MIKTNIIIFGGSGFIGANLCRQLFGLYNFIIFDKAKCDPIFPNLAIGDVRFPIPWTLAEFTFSGFFLVFQHWFRKTCGLDC